MTLLVWRMVKLMVELMERMSVRSMAKLRVLWMDPRMVEWWVQWMDQRMGVDSDLLMVVWWDWVMSMEEMIYLV